MALAWSPPGKEGDRALMTEKVAHVAHCKRDGGGTTPCTAACGAAPDRALGKKMCSRRRGPGPAHGNTHFNTQASQFVEN